MPYSTFHRPDSSLVDALLRSPAFDHPAVAEVAIIGVPDPKWQEVGKAIVVKKEKQSVTEEEIIAFCQDKLARYKIPKSVAFMDVLPRTAAGKVLKRELREQWLVDSGK